MAALTQGLRRVLASPWVVAAGLLAFLASQYAGVLAVPFIGDDFIFLDKTRAAPFSVVWAPRDLLIHYYRPWSRELHYWVLQRLFGAREVPFHLASGALWLAVMALYHSVARRLVNPVAAAGATAAVAALGAWSVPIAWPAGAQDAWMILWALLFLRAVIDGRDTLAALCFALALLSKETAVVLPAIAVAYLMLVAGLDGRTIFGRTVWLWALTLIWATFHPLIGGRLWSHLSLAAYAGVHPSLATEIVRTLATLVNLYPWPAPESGWSHALRQGIPAAILLAGLVASAMLARDNARPRVPTPPGRRITPAVFGLIWAVFAWLPLGMPIIAWRSHYILLGTLGAWLAFAHWLSRSRAALVTVVVALALLRPAIGDTVSHDWSTNWYRDRAAAFITRMRSDLRARRTSFPPHARVFFVRVPSDVGFLTEGGPALRVWYADSTLRGGYYIDYRLRGLAEPRGSDYFFRFDSTGGWVEVIPGPEDVARARLTNPRWEKDHATLAVTLAEGGDWPRAAVEYAKLAASAPANADYAHDAALSFETAGDSLAAATWYARAAALPGADDETRRAAARLAPYLRGHR